MGIAAHLQALGLSTDAVLLSGLLLLVLLMLATLGLLSAGNRRLHARVAAQAHEIAALREEALYRAPAKAAAAATVVTARDRSQDMAAIEHQLSQLLDEWEHVENLSEEAYAILKELRTRAPVEAEAEGERA